MAFTEEKWKELEQNAELKAAMEEADSPEKVYEVLKQYDADVTLEEVKKMTQEAEGELSAEDLDNVAGGIRIRRIRYIVRVYFNPFRIRLVAYYR